MTSCIQLRIAVVTAVLAAGAAHAQTSSATAGIPMRTVAPPSVKSAETIGLIRGLRQLLDGRVLVNDGGRRRVVLYDNALTKGTIVIDSTPGLANSYGRSSVPLITYLGDSTIFPDLNSSSLLVFDGKGKVANVTAIPKAADSYNLSAGGGAAGVDKTGRLLYRVSIRPPIPTGISASGQVVQPPQPDSAAIVRADWDTGAVDTIAKFKIQTYSPMNSKVTPDGKRSYTSLVNPLQWMDDWTVTSDGVLAIVRGQDYHIDFVQPDGRKVSMPKMPYDWRRLTDEDKQTIQDSVRRLNDSLMTANGGGLRSMSVSNGVTTTTIIPVSYTYVPLKEMPDYYPPIRTGSVLADFDGNVWILPYTSSLGGGKGLVYDVVNSNGQLFQRVQLPEGRSIAGFAKGGVIYMMSPAPLEKPTDRPGSAGFYLERTTIQADGATKQQ
ncbi:MAG TPA: hypothetical protein VE967_18075 [Gemmatimonadaceae bacterium]|nr:hypothetical protein [Gemmatimonadaceae bacterium]